MMKFVWHTDRGGMLHFPEPDETLKVFEARYAGRAWPLVDLISDALKARMTFVGVETSIPLTDQQQVRLVLSGTPVIGADGEFDGFRGFGFIEKAISSMVVDTADVSDPVTKPSEINPIGQPMPTAAMGLSANERQAFREIARALGAKPDIDLENEVQASDDMAVTGVFKRENVTPRAAAPSISGHPSDLLGDILDRLPLGILISRGGVPIIMNQPLLGWLGYETIDHFHDLGGIDTLFGGRDPSRRSSDDEGAMLLRRRDGDMVALAVKLQTLQWDDLPASMMIFEPMTSKVETLEPKGIVDGTDTAGVSADELSAILDTATDGVLVLDRDGRMLSMNRSAEALFGIDSEDISGQRFTVLLAEDSRSRALDYLEGLKENGVASVLNDGREVIGETGDGGRIPLFMTMGRLGTNSQPKYCAVLRDISTFKRAEKDFIEARRAAETASARKSDFLARISHEIRTPLSAIIGFAEIMHDERFGQLGNARYRDYLNDILKSGEHVLDLVNDLLDLSKIEAGRADLTFGEVDVNAVLLNAANVLQETANKGSVIVRLSLTSHLPAIVADERSLTQITLNILSNAIKFTPEGGQVIISSNRTPDGEVIIRVKDTGIGMSEGDIATALVPFRQVATSRKGGGTGLGLPLTKALVEANRASMAIRSARHKGTLVEITFPPTRVLADR